MADETIIKLEDYPGNSVVKKPAEAEDKKEVKKVISGNAKVSKKNSFVAADGHEVKDYVLSDVLVPSLKRIIADTIIGAVNMLLFNKGYTGANAQRTASPVNVSYNRYYDDRSRQVYQPVARTGFDFDDIILETRDDANNVLDQLQAIIDQYGIARVSDLYELVGLPVTNFQNNKYGWKDITIADVIAVRGGYMLKMPRPIPIN